MMTPSPPITSGPQPPLSGLAVASMVCAMLVFCPFVAPLAAMVLGTLALRRIRAAAGALRGRGLALAGTFIGSVIFMLDAGLLLTLGSTVNQQMMGRVQTVVHGFVAEAQAGRPDAALAQCAPELARRGDAHQDLRLLGEHLHERYGALQEFRVVSQTQVGSMLAPQLELALHYRFERAERAGWVRLNLAPASRGAGAPSIIPRPLIEKIVIEDPREGNLAFPP